MINMIPLKCCLQNSTYLPIGSAPDFVLDKVANRKKLSKLVRWANQTGSGLERARALEREREKEPALVSQFNQTPSAAWLAGDLWRVFASKAGRRCDKASDSLLKRTGALSSHRKGEGSVAASCACHSKPNRVELAAAALSSTM